MRTDTFILPFITEKEEHFANSIAILIDVLRASTTICAALFNGAKEIIPAENMDKALVLHSNLSKDTRHLAGEINGLKPIGFDSGNSPLEFTNDRINGKSIVLTTSNGTKLFTLLKTPRIRVLASFVNLTMTVEFIKQRMNEFDIDIFCAGNNGRFSFEDTICAGAIIYNLGIANGNMSDSSLACKYLYEQHKDDLPGFLGQSEHAKKLTGLNMQNDVLEALNIDKYPVLPCMEGHSFRIFN